MEKYKNYMILRLLGDKKANKMENMAEIVFLRGGGKGGRGEGITLKLLRLSLGNEIHTKPCTGHRLGDNITSSHRQLRRALCQFNIVYI